MDIIKKKINLSNFYKEGSEYEGNAVIDESLWFLPHHYEDDKMVVMVGTVKRLYGWLMDFITESDYRTVGQRGDYRTFPPAVSTGDTKLEKFMECVAVFPSEAEARLSTDIYCPEMICLNPDCEAFLEMFGGIENAKVFLESDFSSMEKTEPFVEFPILITETSEGLGMYDVYDEKEAGFDDSKINEDTWTDGDILSGSTDFFGSGGTVYYVESQLSTLLRTKCEYDDQGNLLPFVEEGDEYCLPYIIGNPSNVLFDNGVYTYNYLKEVAYYTMDGEYVEKEGNVLVWDDSIPENGIIGFLYEVGAMSGDSGWTSDGIEYLEWHYYTVKNYGRRKYISVDEDTVNKPENYVDGVKYAVVSLECEGETIPASNHLIKTNVYLGVQDAKVSTDDVYIERGSSASYEAFNVLGEVNTIDDIEKYRDDWFRIRGKND